MQYAHFHTFSCPSDVLFKQMCSSGKINKILADVYDDLRKGKEPRDSFLLNSRKLIKEYAAFKENVFKTWVTKRINGHRDCDKELVNEKWDFFDLLFFNLIGTAYNAPVESYPGEALCIKYLNGDVTPSVVERFQSNIVVLFGGIVALNEMRMFSQKRRSIFSNKFKQIVARYESFPTTHSILEAKTELLQLFEDGLADEKQTRIFQKNRDRFKSIKSYFANNCSISVTEDFFSENMDSCLAAVDSAGEECLKSMDSFLHDNALKGYTSDDIRKLLPTFSPPLRPRDENVIHEELKSVDAGVRSIGDTYIGRIILPVINGEKLLEGEDEVLLGEEFSANFIRDLKQGAVHIPRSHQEKGEEGSPDYTEHEESTDVPPDELPAEEAHPAQLTDEKKDFLGDKSPVEGPVPATGNTKETNGSLAEEITETSPMADSAPDNDENFPQVASHAAIDNPAPKEDAEREKAIEDKTCPGDNVFDDDTLVREATETLLATKRTCELYWLMKEKPRPDIPIWLAELLYLGTRLQPGFTSSQNRIKELIEKGETHYGQEGSFSENLSMLLAASLIRPALMMPAITYKSLLDKLIDPLGSYRCEPLLAGLGSFAARGRALDDAVFKGLSLMAQRQKHQETLEYRTRALLDTTLHKKINFQRATAVVKELFSPRGELGQMLYACLDGDYSLLAPNLKKDWSNKAFLSKIVNDLDEQVNKPTKAARKIDYMAFDVIMRDVVAAKQLLTSWNDLVQQGTTASTADFSHKQLNDIVAQAHPESLPDTPYASFFKVQLEELRSKFSTSIASESAVDPLAELMVWPINLEGAEPLPEGFNVPLPELLEYIKKDPAENASQINRRLFGHITRGHFTAVEQFLEVFPNNRTSDLLGVREEQLKRWGTAFTDCVDKVEREIGDAYLRGVIQESQENDLSSEISCIVNSYEQNAIDSFLAVKELEKIRDQLCIREKHHTKELLARLDDVAQDIPEENLNNIKSLIEAGECVQAYDALAQAYDSIAGRSAYALPVMSLRSESSDIEDFFTLLREAPVTLPAPQNETGAVSAWENLVKARTDKNQTGRITELLRWLGFSLAQNVSSEEIYREGRPAWWIVSQYEMTINCPIPQWGSLAGKRHTIVMGWPPQQDYLQTLLKTLFTEKSKKLSKNQPITVLWFGSLSYEQRLRLVQQCRMHNYLPVVIDSNLFYWLHRKETSELRTRALFNVALGGSSSNPYTPNAAGAVPREMFFGRERDIEALWDPFGPCVVYGGRQLGKSALLLQVQTRHHNEAMGQYVLLHSMRQTDSSLIDVALHEMRRVKILPDRATKNNFFDKVKEFLEEDSNRRILLLFDECDAILEQDSKAHRDAKEFPELTVFRDLMMQTEHRFKIVLTGLHSVQRFSRIPNSPLPHFGPPLCVGPLQPDAALALVRQPMECLGLKFETPTLVSKILTYTNYHPSLIQLFCEELVKSMGLRASEASKLPMIIDNSTISQVYKKADLRTKIRQRFDWTLALDKRYRVIGYTLAIWELAEAKNKPSAGMRISSLLDELRTTWPAAFRDMERVGLESLLDEMSGLGILAPVGSMFRLRTPNIIHLLGGDDNILSELEPFYSMPYTPTGRSEELRTILYNKKPDALTIAQHNIIKSRQGGLILVVGTHASGLDRVPDTLEHISRNAEGEVGRNSVTVHRINGTNPHEICNAVSARNKQSREGELIFLLDAREIPAPLDVLLKLQDWQQSLRSDKKFVKIVCLIDAKEFIELQRKKRADELCNNAFTQILFLHRWTQASLEDWHHQSNTVPSASMESILRKTGGWDACVMAHIEDRENPDIAQPGYSLPDTPEVANLVRALIEYGDNLSEEDLRMLTHGDPHFDELLETLTGMEIFIRSHENLLSLEHCLATALKEARAA